MQKQTNLNISLFSGIKKAPTKVDAFDLKSRMVSTTSLLKAGAKPELLQKIIGHANYETTIDTYTHFTEEDIGELVLQVNKI